MAIAGGPDSGVLAISVKGQNGQDFFCYPAPDGGIALNHKLFFHLVGTFSDPAGNHEFPLEACRTGFAAIDPLYENETEVATLCNDAGAEQDACIIEAHESIVYGHSYALADGAMPASYDVPNSVVGRTQTLLTYLTKAQSVDPDWAHFSQEIPGGPAPDVVLAGHSQGSGQALYLAHGLGPERVVELSGPTDRVKGADGGTNTPSWMANFAVDAGLGPQQIYTFNNAGDGVVPIADAELNDDSLGVTSAWCAFDQPMDAGCRRLLIDAGCDNPYSPKAGLDAHDSTDLSEAFGPAPACQPRVVGHDNQAAWDYLLSGQ